MREVPRRTFLLGGLATGSFVLAACGGDDGADDTSADGVVTRPEGVDATTLAFLVATFPDGFRQAPTLVAGPEQRIAFVVADQIDNMRESAPATIDLRVTRDEAVILETTIEQHVDGIITPYYPAAITFDTIGTYRAELPEFPEVAPVDFVVVEPSEVAIPQAGDSLPAVPTPTDRDALGVDPICTRAIACPFHEHDLAEVVGNGRPTILLVATPGFCQTDICGPVVDLLIDEASERNDLDVIHLEVYVDPSEFASGGFPDLVPAVATLALPFEPALFVADADGTIAARLDTTFDRRELRAALALV